MVRLYVGGLDKDVTEQLLSSRFVSFGSVEGCEIVHCKDGDVRSELAGGCRGFAYVDLLPKDDAALHRCLSTYNGCRWRGGVLRVEKARPDYRAQLQEEWESQKQEIEAQQAAAAEDAEPLPEHVTPLSTEKPVRMTRPGGKKSFAVTWQPPPGSRTLFPPFKQTPLQNITWD